MKNLPAFNISPRYQGLRCAFARFWLLQAAIVYFVQPGYAADKTWDGGGIDNNWSTGENWSGDLAPINPTLPTLPDVIRLAGAVRLSPVVDSAWAVDTLHFNSGAGTFNLSGQTITFQPSNGENHDSRFFLINASGKTQTINNNLVVTSALTGTTRGSGISAGATGNLILNGNLDLGTISGIRFQGGAGTITVNGVISGTPGGTTAVNGGATLILNNTNTFTNSFTVWSGTAKLAVDAPNGANGALGNSTSEVIMGHGGATGARLLTGAGVTVGRSIALIRNTDNKPYTIGGDTAHVSNFTGVIYTGASTKDAPSNAAIVTAGAGGRVNINSITRRAEASATSSLQDTVTKQGEGIVALTGTSNYSGQTIVSGGTLLVNGSLSASSPTSASVGNVNVATGATLGGIGSIDRNVVVQSGGIFAPGDISSLGINQGGKLTLGAGLNLSDSTILNFDLTTALSLTDDEVVITGDLVLDGQLNVTALGGFGVGSYKLFEYSGSLTNNGISFGNMPAGFTYSIDTTSVPQTVVLTVVPEPGAAALLGIGGALLAIRRRRTPAK